MEIQTYRFRLTHDNGTVVMRTAATSEEAARKMIMEAEGCPNRAMQLL